jgi:hypothetical protein
MDGLARLAEEFRCGILLLRHLSKQSGGKAIHRGLGSIDLTGAVRSELLAGSLPDDPDARALVHIKSNVGPTGRTLTYSINEDGRFSWTGESSLTAADLLAAPAGPDGQKIAEATHWLSEQLKARSCEQKEIRERAAQAGITYATLRRAKESLKVRSHKDGMSGPWMWALPEGAQEGANTENVSSFVRSSAFEEAHASTKMLKLTSLYSEGAQQPLCEHIGKSMNAFDQEHGASSPSGKKHATVRPDGSVTPTSGRVLPRRDEDTSI